jgi:hypothetical protein
MGNEGSHHNHGGEHQDKDMASDDKIMRKEEAIIEGKKDYKIGSKEFVEMPKWPILLVDATGSMNETVSERSTVTRKDLVKEVCRQVSWRLAPVDDADNQQSNYKGVPFITFNEMDGGVDRGFLHYATFDAEWNNVYFRSGTHIMDGWRTMLKRYEQSFMGKPQNTWPLLLALIITDGELQDGHEFEEHMKHVHGKVFVEIAVVGYGEDHERACRHYAKISKKHPHVRVTEFTNSEFADTVVNQLLSMVNPALVRATSTPPPTQMPPQNPWPNTTPQTPYVGQPPPSPYPPNVPYNQNPSYPLQPPSYQ